jgi:hypothetical protein
MESASSPLTIGNKIFVGDLVFMKIGSNMSIKKILVWVLKIEINGDSKESWTGISGITPADSDFIYGKCF